jgi:hypothetical protein
MKKIFLISVLAIILAIDAFAQYKSISVDAIYIVVYEKSSLISYGNPEYIAEIEKMIGSDSGAVKMLLKLGRTSDIKSGNYKIQLEDMKNDLYRISGTDYVLNIKYGLINTFKSYVMKVSGYSIILEEIKTY